MERRGARAGARARTDPTEGVVLTLDTINEQKNRKQERGQRAPAALTDSIIQPNDAMRHPNVRMAAANSYRTTTGRASVRRTLPYLVTPPKRNLIVTTIIRLLSESVESLM